MEGGCWRMPLMVLMVLTLAVTLGHFQHWGGFQERPMSKKNMNSTLNFFIQSYNNNSNDTYLFRVQKLLRSQMQLTTGVEYKVTVKIGRTKCKRNSRTNSSCPLQKKKLKKVNSGQIHLIGGGGLTLEGEEQAPRKSLICESLIYTVPWINYFRMWNNSCHDN